MVPQMPQALCEEQREKWDAYCEVLEKNNIQPHAHGQAADVLQQAFLFSDYVYAVCMKTPKVAESLIKTGDLFESYEKGRLGLGLDTLIQDGAKDKGVPIKDMDTAMVESFLQPILRRFRHREMIRIAARDYAGLTHLDEVTKDLSDLAGICLDRSISLLHTALGKTFGFPEDALGKQQQLVVLGMGKLGANELNFSSDIDLIFAYPGSGFTKNSDKSISNEDFFTRLCRSLIKVIGANTGDGFVFRVDTRLRPYGDGGPLVMSFAQMEDYYQRQGREWERYALIKAAVVAGDKKAGADLIQGLKPFIYRKYLDYGVFDSLRDMKRKITLEVKKKGVKDNIKLGAGGIREIEFFGQMFQLIRGGVFPDLREPRIRKVLSILEQEKFVPAQTCRDLDAAYVFLRNTEHRLQAHADRQTHNLPQNDDAKNRLALSMAFASWKEFKSALDGHQETVHRHFSGLLKPVEGGHESDSGRQGAGDQGALEGVWESNGCGEEEKKALMDAGFDDPQHVQNLLGNFKEQAATRSLSATGRSRLDRLLPGVLKETGGSAQPEVVLDRILKLLKSIQQRISYLSLLLEHPAALSHLVRLADASPWIADFLSRHPVLLDELLDHRSLYVPPGKTTLEKELDLRMGRIDTDDLENQMEALRIFKQVNTLRVAASDITSVLPLMKVSDHLSYIAETVLKKVVALSWAYLVEKHGKPLCELDGKKCETGFAVIGYGKLGGIELGYGSDLDLVFIHAASKGETKGGKRAIDNSQFFARLGQRVVHLLTAHTSAGKLYETDMRLRPSGASGLLVSHVDGFRDYQLNDAWTWEHQALIRARAITGDKALKKKFIEIRKEALVKKRDAAGLKKEVVDMRGKMRKELLKTEPGMFDLKQGEGGIVDIEFLVQYLVLQKSRVFPELLGWTDNVRLIQTLWETGLFSENEAYILRRAYLVYRATGHRMDLSNQEAKTDKKQFLYSRKVVEKIWNQFFK